MSHRGISYYQSYDGTQWRCSGILGHLWRVVVMVSYSDPYVRIQTHRTKITDQIKIFLSDQITLLKVNFLTELMWPPIFIRFLCGPRVAHMTRITNSCIAYAITRKNFLANDGRRKWTDACYMGRQPSQSHRCPANDRSRRKHLLWDYCNEYMKRYCLLDFRCRKLLALCCSDVIGY